MQVNGAKAHAAKVEKSAEDSIDGASGNANAAMADARNQGAKLTTEAQTDSDKLVEEAKAKAEALAVEVTTLPDLASTNQLSFIGGKGSSCHQSQGCRGCRSRKRANPQRSPAKGQGCRQDLAREV